MLRAFDTYIRNFVTESDPSPVAEPDAQGFRIENHAGVFRYAGRAGAARSQLSAAQRRTLYSRVGGSRGESMARRVGEDRSEHDLRMALQNRVGLPANDFRYTLASGRTGTLYGIRANYTLVFFNNPDCGMCERIRAEIVASPLLSEMIRAGRLEVLALYPDEDLTAWRAHAPQVPSSWINAYDAGARISKEELYDLKAIPSMYLLDRDKRVLAKDAFEVGISNGCSTGSRSDGRIGLFYRSISKSDRIFAGRDPIIPIFASQTK